MSETYINSDKVIFGDLLSSQHQYKVPIYQRSYSWDEDHTEQLWIDLTEVMQAGKSEYFLGPIVVVKKDGNLKEIIDGQQRLVTLSVLLCAMRDILKERNDMERSTDINILLGKKDFRAQKIIPKLTLNEFDNNFYENNILNNQNVDDIKASSIDKQLGASNRLIALAYMLFKDKISVAIAPTNAIDFIIDLYDTIVKKVCLIEIAVTDEADAYALFETLNDRGLDLSVADLLKNFIFGKAGNKINDIKQTWNEINFILGKRSVAQFLRHYWISHEPLVTEKELYRKIRDKYKNKETLPLINSLKDSAKIYAAFRQPDNEIWDSQGTSVKEHLSALRLFDVVQCFPLLLAAYEQDASNLFPKVLEMVVNISFRYTVICEKRTGLLERVYCGAATKIRKSEVHSGPKIFAALKDIYPDDIEFKNSFCEKRIGKDNKLGRYIMLKLEKNVSNTVVYEPCDNERQVNLEHILPENPNQDWSSDFDLSKAKEFIYRIGNLALLPVEKNQKRGSKSFKDKCNNAYKGCGLKITEDLLEYDKWNSDSINIRQNKLADIALNVWCIKDYA